MNRTGWETLGSQKRSRSFCVSFGRNFEYEFEADGTLISITGTNVTGQSYSSGASTFGLNPFRWRIFDLTSVNGFQAVDFLEEGTLTLPTIVGHDYLLRMSDTSNVSGSDAGNLGLVHSASFNVAKLLLRGLIDYDQ